MPMKPEEVISKARARFWAVSIMSVVLGTVGSIWNYLLPWEWAQHLARDVSVALFVAALLSVSVETFFRAEFARDVFYAAFSYVLPDELKEEINRVINYKFICERHHMILKITEIDDTKNVRLEVRLERT
jgi:hypothetical protein